MIMHSADRKINFTERSGLREVVTDGDGLCGCGLTRAALDRISAEAG
jgi:hypothetical protein